MCRSMAEGGQRCAAHTREKLTLKATAVEQAVKALTAGHGDPSALRTAQEEWETAAAEYASTDEGHTHLSTQAAAAGDMDTQALLNTVIAKGEALRAANRETAALIKAVKLAGATPAAGALVRTNGSAITPPDDSLFERRVVRDLSAKEREAWTKGLADLAEVAPIIDQVKMWGGHGTSQMSPDELLASLNEIDEKAADPTLDDSEAANLVARLDRYQGINTMMPDFVRPEVERQEGEAYHDWQDRRHEVYSAQDRQWYDVVHPFQKAIKPQVDRILAHPGAGHKTFEQAEQYIHRKAIDLTDHPNAPISYLRQTARKAPTHMSVNAWGRLRGERLNTETGTSDNGVAMVLAMHDPDSFHRNDAYAQVEVMDFDSVSKKQRGFLARNLHRLPGAPGRQAILATSLVEWSKMATDADEQTALYRLLAESKTAEVAEVGQRALQRAGIALVETVTAPDAPEERSGGFWRRNR